MNKIILTFCILTIIAIIVIAVIFAVNPGKQETSEDKTTTLPAKTPDANKPIVNKPIVDNNTTKPTPTDNNTNNNSTTPVTSTPSGYTLQDVAKHNTQTDCWQAINGIIYDLSSFSDVHSGGSRTIITGCGQDTSAEFNRKHGSSETRFLQKYKVGALQ